MNKEFVSNQQALELQQLGFDEPCIGKFYYNQLEIGGIWTNNDFKDDPDIFISAPLYQQVFRWFREKYGYWSYVKEATKGTARFYIEKFDEKFFNSEIYNSYQEAELECLKKLIKIVKNEKT